MAVVVSKLHRNAIQTGDINCYCLTCEILLNSVEDAFSHINENSHVKNLETTSYVAKYRDDYIRKIKKIYYCECCNLIISTLAKVGIHTKNPNHMSNKVKQILRRDGSLIIAFENVVINEQAWNGLTDITCNVCNVEIENEVSHMSEESHLLNVMQSKVECGAGNSVYRRIDEQTFQCLTCNKVIGNTALATHIEDSKHKQLYAKCQESYKSYNQKQKASNENKIKVSSSQPLFKPGFLNTKKPVVKPSEPVNAKPVENTKPVENMKPVVKANPTENLITQKKPGQNSKDAIDIDEEICKCLNARNYIIDDETNQKWCIVCDWHMGPSNVPLHMSDKHHQIMVKLHKKRLEKKKNANGFTNFESKPQDNEAENKNQDSNECESRDKMLESIDRYRQLQINVDFLSSTASCRKCLQSIDFNYKAIEEHIEDHEKKILIKEKQMKKESKISKNEPKPVVEKKAEARKLLNAAPKPKEIDAAVEKFANDNDLYITKTNKAYCSICNVETPLTLRNMREHITGMAHRHRAQICQRARIKPVVTKTDYTVFIKTIVGVENGFMKDVVINGKYCINGYSFMGIGSMDDEMNCYFCEIIISENALDEHLRTERHKRALAHAPVLTSMETEFFREVRPDVYHCGYCNSVVHSLEEVESHCVTNSHLENSRGASWKLLTYRPQLNRSQAQQVDPIDPLGILLRCTFF